MFTVYAIPNCNTVKKAIDWLKKNNVFYTFHDYKKSGIEELKLKEWTNQIDWQLLLNKKGTTWKQLEPAVQNSIVSAEKAIELMMQKTSVIKRPLIEKNGKIILLGFEESAYEKAFLTHL